MPDIEVTDQLDKPIESIKIDVSRPSSLIKYLKSELLHLAVAPDFVARKDSILSKAAEKPIQFEAKAKPEFQLGSTKPKIDVTPDVEAIIRVNASSGTNLFSGDSFQLPAKVPAGTGYVSVGFEGSLDLGVSGSDGDLTFGFDRTSGIKLEYLKAFPLGKGEPTLGAALGDTMSSYVIPADLSDVELLGVNDIATVSGKGSLTICGGVKVTAFPNPLASVDLPLGTGTIAVKAGPVAGLTASFTISGSYQVRVRRIDGDTFELSVSRETGTTFKSDFSASAGITASLDGTDLIAAVLDGISTDPVKDKQALAGLQPPEMKAVGDAIKNGLDHSVQACIDVVLSAATDDQPAFQYRIEPARLSPEANAGVQKALKGDLSALTAMEYNIQPSGILAPGLKMLNSVLSETCKRDAALRINLLGILNYLTISELIRNSETLTDGVTGDVTIKETVTGSRISAVIDPQDRAEALRKAMFDSMLATTSYRAGRAVAVPDLSCDQVHFTLRDKTERRNMTDYLNWFMALNLLTQHDKEAFLTNFADGGRSTCVLRTSFGDADCTSMFFDETGDLRQKQYYLEIGRRALQALLDPQDNPNDRLRYQMLNDALWPQALKIGANSNLGPLAGLSTSDAKVEYLIGDVELIASWAKAMVEAGALVQDMRRFVGNSDPTALIHDNEFKSKREALQNKLSDMVKASKTRFEEPWGMVCLFWAGGSPHTAYAKAITQRLTVERVAERTLAADGR